MKHPKCKTCGKEHALGGCPEFQSTAARKDVQSVENGSLAKAKQDSTRRPDSAQVSGSQLSPVAGTQALPVDTLPKPKIGRPRTGFNKKEYNRQFTSDLRTIKRLGLNCTVKEYRMQLAMAEDIRKDYGK